MLIHSRSFYLLTLMIAGKNNILTNTKKLFWNSLTIKIMVMYQFILQVTLLNHLFRMGICLHLHNLHKVQIFNKAQLKVIHLLLLQNLIMYNKWKLLNNINTREILKLNLLKNLLLIKIINPILMLLDIHLNFPFLLI